MTLTREDPGPLRTRVASARVATVFAALLSVVTAAAVYRYGADVLDYAREQGLESSAIETWSRPAALLLIALPAGWTVASAVGLRRVLGRFRIAADFERRLSDPRSAASVPPLASHLIQLNRKGAGRAGRHLIASVAVTVLLLVLATGFGDEWDISIPQQGRTAVWLVAGLFGVIALLAIRSLRSALLRTRVEKLSTTDLPRRPMSASAPTATTVPGLSIRFAGPLHPVPVAGTAPTVLYLRLFDNLAGTDRFVARWRRFGVVHYLRSADQVTAADLRAGKSDDGVHSAFIDDDAALEDFLHDGGPARTGRHHRVRGLLCHGSYWKRAVVRLLQEVDLVVLDLTGFHPGHGGTAFELQAALDLVDVARLRLLASRDSDQKYLAAQVRGAWAALAAGSPNAGGGARTITVHLG